MVVGRTWMTFKGYLDGYTGLGYMLSSVNDDINDSWRRMNALCIRMSNCVIAAKAQHIVTSLG